MRTSDQTHNHDRIRKWAEERGGVPAKVKSTGNQKSIGVLRIHFPEESLHNAELEKISWEDFFQQFEASDLDLLYQDTKEDGEASTFHKFVERT